MAYKTYKDSKFGKIIRLKKSQLDWLKKNKPKEIKTLAGYLDIIINNYKKNGLPRNKT